MMNKALFFLVIALGLVVGSVLYAQTTASEITFPVAELGGCEDKEACFDYCERPENGRSCLAFAQKHGLLPVEEIRVAEKVLSVTGGPGGCTSQRSCENYCNDASNIDVCLAFAEENGLMEREELEEAKKVQAALRSGAKLPGGCRNKNECENYCENPDNMDECLAFAEAAGFIPPDELEQARKFAPLIKSGQTPGGCKTKDACQAYCESDANFTECIDFAEKNGLIPEGERKNIEAFKRAGGKGPGGCVGRQCEAFCENPANQEACFTWAKENGLLKEEDVQRMQQGAEQIERALGEAPPEVKGCIEAALGPGGLDKIRSGEFFGGEAIGEKIGSCFQGMRSGSPSGVPDVRTAEDCAKYGGDWDGSRCDFGKSECSRQGGSWDGRTCKFPEGQFQGPQKPIEQGPGILPPPGSEFSGPGGCKTADECQRYCQANPTACQGFASPGINPMDTSEYCLQQGGDWIDNRCSFGGRECQNQGGAWDGSKCSFINPMDTPEYCLQQGGNFIGGRCDFGGKNCVNQGGIWDGSSCQFPNLPPSSQRPSESFLGQILRTFGPLIGVE